MPKFLHGFGVRQHTYHPGREGEISVASRGVLELSLDSRPKWHHSVATSRRITPTHRLLSHSIEAHNLYLPRPRASGDAMAHVGVGT